MPDTGGGGGNATVPDNGAPLSSPQAFVDFATAILGTETVDAGDGVALYEPSFLIYSGGGDISGTVGQSPDINFVDFTTLESVSGSLGLNNNDTLLAADFPALTSINGTISLSGCEILASADFPVLVSVGGTLDIFGSALTAVNLPSLTSIAGEVYYNESLSLITAEFPELASIAGTLDMSLDPVLSTVEFPSLTSLDGTLILNGCALDTATVDALLISLAATVTNGTGTVDVSGQTPTAPPTGASAAAITYLQGLGITVTTD